MTAANRAAKIAMIAHAVRPVGSLGISLEYIFMPEL